MSNGQQSSSISEVLVPGLRKMLLSASLQIVRLSFCGSVIVPYCRSARWGYQKCKKPADLSKRYLAVNTHCYSSGNKQQTDRVAATSFSCGQRMSSDLGSYSTIINTIIMLINIYQTGHNNQDLLSAFHLFYSNL